SGLTVGRPLVACAVSALRELSRVVLAIWPPVIRDASPGDDPAGLSVEDLASSGGGLLPWRLAGEEGLQAEVVLAAGRTAVEVRPHAGDRVVGRSTLELDLDIAVELVEALLAAELGLLGAQQAAQGDVSRLFGVLAHGRPPSLAEIAWPSASSFR